MSIKGAQERTEDALDAYSAWSADAAEKVASATETVAPMQTDVARAKSRQMGDRAQLGLGTILAALVVVIAVSLAVIVVDQFDQSLGNPDSSELSTAQGDVLSGFADMTSLIGPLLLVSIAVVIIGLVRRVQSS